MFEMYLNTLSIKQAEYAKILAQEFLREFTHFADVAAGRAAPRSDFIEKLWQLVLFPVKLATSGTETVGGNLAMAMVDEIGSQWHERRKMSKAEAISDLYDQLGFHQIKIIAERTALEAARRYQYVIDVKLADDIKESIVPLAKAGALRMLEYLARHQPYADLTVDNLLTGLIEGRSGKWIDGWLNTSLKTKNKADKHFRAEGVYARSGLRGPRRGFWALAKNKALHMQWRSDMLKHFSLNWDAIAKETEKEVAQLLTKQNENDSLKKQLKNFSNKLKVPFKNWKKHQLDPFLDSFFSYGYVHFRNPPHQHDPKYGYADVPQMVIKKYGYMASAVGLHSEEFNQSLVTYMPWVQRVTRKDVQEYMLQLKELKEKKLFREYIAEKYPGSRVPVCVKENLTQLDLQGGDFSDCDFSETSFGGCLDSVIFSRTQLYKVNFQRVTSAKGANFSHAYLVMADFGEAGTDLTGADLTQARLDYALLGRSQLGQLKERGSTWVGVDLSQVVDIEVNVLEKMQNEQVALLKRSEETTRALYCKIEKQHEVVENKLNQLRSQITDIGSEAKEEIKEIISRICSEQEMRESFQIHCELQLQELKSQQKVQGDSLKKLDKKVELLAKQNVSFAKDLQNEIVTLSDVILQVKQQKVEQQQLAAQAMTFRQQLTQLAQRQHAMEMGCVDVIDSLQQRNVWHRLVRMVEQLANDPLLQEQRAYYIPVRGTYENRSDETYQDVREEVDKFISRQERYKDTRVMLLLGSSGTGKTVFCQGLAVELARQWLKAIDSYKETTPTSKMSIPPIPLYVALPRLKDPQSALLAEIFKRYDFNEQELAELKNYPFTFLFDSFDEIADDKLKGESNLYRSNNLQDWKNTSVLFCCRTEYSPLFSNVKENKYKLFGPYSEIKSNMEQQLRVLFLMPFQPRQITDYIKQYLKVPEMKSQISRLNEPEWSDYHIYLKYIGVKDEAIDAKVENTQTLLDSNDNGSIPGIKDLVTNPFLLRVTMEALPIVVREYQKQDAHTKSFDEFTHDQLFDVYMPQWFDRQKQKLIQAKDVTPDYLDLEAECWAYCKALATRMQEQRLSVITYTEELTGVHIFTAKRTTEHSIWKRFFTETNSDVQLIRKCCPVKLVGLDPNQWAFFHEDFKTFFVTKLEEEFALEQRYDLKMYLNDSNELHCKNELDQNRIFLYKSGAEWVYTIFYMDNMKKVSHGEISEDEIIEQLDISCIEQLDVVDNEYQLSLEQKCNLLAGPEFSQYTQPDDEDNVDPDAIIDDIDNLKRTMRTVVMQQKQQMESGDGLREQLMLLTNRIEKLESNTYRELVGTKLPAELPPKNYLASQAELEVSTEEQLATAPIDFEM